MKKLANFAIAMLIVLIGILIPTKTEASEVPRKGMVYVMGEFDMYWSSPEMNKTDSCSWNTVSNHNEYTMLDVNDQLRVIPTGFCAFDKDGEIVAICSDTGKEINLDVIDLANVVKLAIHVWRASPDGTMQFKLGWVDAPSIYARQKLKLQITTIVEEGSKTTQDEKRVFITRDANFVYRYNGNDYYMWRHFITSTRYEQRDTKLWKVWQITDNIFDADFVPTAVLLNGQNIDCGDLRRELECLENDSTLRIYTRIPDADVMPPSKPTMQDNHSRDEIDDMDATNPNIIEEVEPGNYDDGHLDNDGWDI